MHKPLALFVPLALCAAISAQSAYRTPPQPLVDCLDAAPPPSVSVAPSKAYLLLTDRESMPSLAVQARPILRLAGQRIDPATRGPRRGARSIGFTLLTIADGTQRRIPVPADADLGSPVWTADGTRFAFTNTLADRIELWVADVASATCERIDGVQLVATMGTPVRWLPEQRTLLCRLVSTPGQPPAPPAMPSGPTIQESTGRKSPVRTYQDLLQNAHDAALFEHFMSCQLAEIDPADGSIRKIGDPGLFARAGASPNGAFLLVEQIQRPFSYLQPASSFPREIAVWQRADGSAVRTIAKVPLAEGIPIGGVRTGRRSVAWIPTADATLMWREALDGGDPKAKVEHRDQVSRLDLTATDAKPALWFATKHRLSDVSFGAHGDLALVSEYDRDRRWIYTSRVDPRTPIGLLTPVADRSMQDAYADPGRPLTTRDGRGQRVLQQDGNLLFLTGRGSSPQGDRPFLDAWSAEGDEKTRLFHCADERYEEVVALLADDASRVLVRRESRTEPPNYFVVETGGDRAGRALTTFRDPIAQLTEGITHKRLHYERADGVKLTATLYLPAGHREGERLPTLVWAYPREFTSAKTAGQVRGSTHRYTRLSGSSPLLLTLAGYAVLNNAAMPVIGSTETANDTFIDQLVAGARAAIDTAAALGVTDPDRVAIAGHSYGAFMTANLLAHSDLFRAGVARSGAYNRTLTPFGFQNERRTFWEAPQIYFAMSPFMHAHKIDEPLLMIHGEADNNSGTFPIQSRRLFHAIKGNGGRARLVMLPHESHGYRARESVAHCLAETVDWLDRYVKNAKPREIAPAEASGGKGR